ncbi:MAG: hypothetical protein QOI20_3238 [Acidimicrobiaceae bacterium]|jgi:hypothetical protein|nr:hypothetical protein [Acidimicrobiaceae bacterium]
MPTVKADPFDVQMTDEQEFGLNVMEPLSGLPLDYEIGKPSRWQDLGDGWLVIDRLAQIAGKYPRWEGAIQRVFNTEHPNEAGPNHPTQPLQLAAEKGLGEHVAFLYDETSRLLWLQRDRRVCGKMHFTDYLRTMAAVSFSLAVRLRKDSVKRARKLRSVRRLEFAYLTQESHQAKGSLEELLAKFTGYGAARIEVTLTPVRGGTLNPSVKHLVDGLATEIDDKTGGVRKALVSGRMTADEDEDDTLIDMLRDRTPMSTSVAANRTRSADRLIAAVRSIWSNNRSKV